MLGKICTEPDKDVIIKFLESVDLDLDNWLNIPQEDSQIKDVNQSIEEFMFRMNLTDQLKSKNKDQILSQLPISKETFDYQRKTHQSRKSKAKAIFDKGIDKTDNLDKNNRKPG